jgi:cell division septation protein DedD
MAMLNKIFEIQPAARAMRVFKHGLFCLTPAILLATLAAGCSQCSQQYSQTPTVRDGISDGTRPTPSDQPTSTPVPNEQLPPKPKTELGEKQYTALVGSFANPEEADQLAFDLRKARISNFIDHAGGRWYVCVGKFYTYNRARRVVEELYEQGYTSAEVYGPGHSQ